MMEITHDLLVYVAKTHNLFYLLGFFVLTLIYCFWPSNKNRFDKAAKSVLNDEDGPCL